MSKIRDSLYAVKEHVRRLWIYPVKSLKSTNYDEYWKDKRGVNFGNLSMWQKMRADLALEVFARHEEPLSLLDYGCGDGSVLSYIKSKARLKTAIGADVSLDALAFAKNSGLETVKVVPGVYGLFSEYNPDYVIFFEVLEHVSDSEGLLLAGYEASQKGVVFSIPNTGYIFHRLRLLFGSFPLQWHVSPSEHLRFWTMRDLKWWLRALGFNQFKVRGYKGVPILNKLWPALFAAGSFVVLHK